MEEDIVLYENLFIEWNKNKQQKVGEIVMKYIQEGKNRKHTMRKDAVIDHNTLIDIILTLVVVEK